MPTREIRGRAALLRETAKSQSERSFQREVIAFAKAHGWRVAHFRPARKADGTWYTPIEGDA